MKTGVELIADERKRQIEVEGWDEEHDSEITDCALAVAAAAYALDVAANYTGEHETWKDLYKEYSVAIFPFDDFKPTPNDPIRQLVKAGALIAAEIDKLQHKIQNEISRQ